MRGNRKTLVVQQLTDMEVDHQGNIRASELRISVHRAKARRAIATGPYLIDSLAKLANEAGLVLELTQGSNARVEWGPKVSPMSEVVFESDWRLPSKR